MTRIDRNNEVVRIIIGSCYLRVFGIRGLGPEEMGMLISELYRGSLIKADVISAACRIYGIGNGSRA